jgi:hypothetical protein
MSSCWECGALAPAVIHAHTPALLQKTCPVCETTRRVEYPPRCICGERSEIHFWKQKTQRNLWICRACATEIGKSVETRREGL